MGRKTWMGIVAVALAAACCGGAAGGVGKKPAASEPATRAAAPGEFVRYERVQPVFKSKAIIKAHGDAIVAALHGGEGLENWQSHAAAIGHFGDFTCILPPPTPITIEGIRADGSRYEMDLNGMGAVVMLQDAKGSRQLYGLTSAAGKEMAAAITALDADLRAEVLATPRPMTYVIGTLGGDDTLSGIARVFYGKPGRWKDIYAANRATLKDPNQIRAGMKLVIPR